MKKLIVILSIFFFISSASLLAQLEAIEKMLYDNAMSYASVSFTLMDSHSSEIISEYNSDALLTPASTLKLVTTAAAFEYLGGDFTFETAIYYSGEIDSIGVLHGDIIIKGGGDPTLGATDFSTFYGDFISKWTTSIQNFGIKAVLGRVIADDSYFDYLPISDKWIWEDIGNYFGAGVYGLMAYDNSYRIYFRTGGEGTKPSIVRIEPKEYEISLDNMLTASGTSDKGYIYTAPYSKSGWISGTIPTNRSSFSIKGAITDPPLLIARQLDRSLRAAGINITEAASTSRLTPINTYKQTFITKTVSPPLKEIIYILNRKSVNLYAETVVKTLGKIVKGSGSYTAGLEVISDFLEEFIGIDYDEFRIYDGSGLSPVNRISSRVLAGVLCYMTHSDCADDYLRSLSVPGEIGTLQNTFTNTKLRGILKAKSGTLNAVKSYAGHILSDKGRDLTFCIIVNNFSGNSSHIINLIKDLLIECSID